MMWIPTALLPLLYTDGRVVPDLDVTEEEEEHHPRPMRNVRAMLRALVAVSWCSRSRLDDLLPAVPQGRAKGAVAAQDVPGWRRRCCCRRLLLQGALDGVL